MTLAPDYELWTRALSAGYKFAVLPKKLTIQSIHENRVTHSDPSAAFLEMTYVAGRNLTPLAFARAQYGDVQDIVSWASESQHCLDLTPSHTNQAIANLVVLSEFLNYKQFLDALKAKSPPLERLGIFLRKKVHVNYTMASLTKAPPTQVEASKTAVLANELIVNLPTTRPLRSIALLLRSRKFVAVAITIFGYVLVVMQKMVGKSPVNSNDSGSLAKPRVAR
jgi:hypothetical protein